VCNEVSTRLLKESMEAMLRPQEFKHYFFNKDSDSCTISHLTAIENYPELFREALE
jgi:hypothetical protein